MRIGVIRGDVPGGVTLQDLETISQRNPTTEPEGQTRHIDRPVPATVGAALPASTLLGTVDVSGGATVVVATSDDLKVKTDAGAGFDTATVAAAAYGTGQALVTAINAALVAAGSLAVASLDESGTFLVLSSNESGEGSYIEVDSTGGGSNINALVGLNGAGDSFTMPAATAVIAALLPVGGPLDVSDATVDATVGEGLTQAQRDALADTIAPQFIETDVAIKSFQVGMISGFASATWNPDVNRLPPIAAGAAIEVVDDDGVTPFVAALTAITSATADAPNAGDLTIVGTNLGVVEEEDQTVVRVTNPATGASVRIQQQIIIATNTGGTQGVVTPTSIVIPASLLNGLGAVDNEAQVQYTSLASGVEVVV